MQTTSKKWEKGQGNPTMRVPVDLIPYVSRLIALRQLREADEALKKISESTDLEGAIASLR